MSGVGEPEQVREAKPTVGQAHGAEDAGERALVLALRRLRVAPRRSRHLDADLTEEALDVVADQGLEAGMEADVEDLVLALPRGRGEEGQGAAEKGLGFSDPAAHEAAGRGILQETGKGSHRRSGAP